MMIQQECKLLNIIISLTFTNLECELGYVTTPWKYSFLYSDHYYSLYFIVIYSYFSGKLINPCYLVITSLEDLVHYHVSQTLNVLTAVIVQFVHGWALSREIEKSVGVLKNFTQVDDLHWILLVCELLSSKLNLYICATAIATCNRFY